MAARASGNKIVPLVFLVENIIKHNAEGVWKDNKAYIMSTLNLIVNLEKMEVVEKVFTRFFFPFCVVGKHFNELYQFKNFLHKQTLDFEAKWTIRRSFVGKLQLIYYFWVFPLERFTARLDAARLLGIIDW